MLSSDIIRKIVGATKVKTGELILLHFWGEDSDREVVNNFCIEVVKLGATPMVLQQSRKLNEEIFTNAKESCFNEKYYKMFENLDAVIDIFMYEPVVLGAKIEEKQMNLYRKYMANLFNKLLKAKRFTQIRIPTYENSKGSNLSEEEFIEKMIKAYDIDYEELTKNCKKKLKEIEGCTKAKVITNGCYELNLVLNDRKWEIDDGDGDMPCGEIGIAPIEECTNGQVFYKKLYAEEAGEFDDIILNISEGKLIDSNNEKFNEFLNTLSDNDKVICELGLGMNPNITGACGYAVLDEKECNTFHIAIGINTMFGGKNNANIHMDFVGKGEVIFE